MAMLKRTDGLNALFFLCLSAMGCAQPLCQLRAPLKIQYTTSKLSEMATSEWMMLLMRGPSHTCVGAQAAPEGSFDLPPNLRVKPSHVFQAAIDGSKTHVVWLKTHSQNGTFVGPVALVSERSHTLEVLALGTLQLPPGDVTFRWVPFDGGQALWSESRACIDHYGVNQPLCRQQLRLLPLRGQTFTALENAPTVDLLRQEVRPMSQGRALFIDQRVECDVKDKTLLLQEHIDIREMAMRGKQMHVHGHREAHNRRVLAQRRDGGWQSSGTSLWEQFLPDESDAEP